MRRILPPDQQIEVRPLTHREKRLYQNLRNDKMLRLADVPRLLGMTNNPVVTRALISQGCPIYRIGRGPFRVFSGDVIRALNGLDIVHNGKWGKELDALYRKGVRSGSDASRASGRKRAGSSDARSS